ncbi:hypothetical protein [Actinoplanes philippinensis]|uniref:hypothetical protein n=1 Tax=Actinoplanes philippinensis TaxID=35752 RepID=UPI003402674F
MQQKIRRLAATGTGIAAFSLMSLGLAAPANAGTCTGNACGTVQNSSGVAVLIGEWTGNPGHMTNVKVLMPGEHSQKYLRDTDGFALQCNGVVLWGSGSTSNIAAHQEIKISDFNHVDIRYQGC